MYHRKHGVAPTRFFNMPITPPLEIAKAALRDKTLSPSAVAFKIVNQCRRAHQLATADEYEGAITHSYDDTPGLEGYLWDIWAALTDVAEEDPSSHDRLASVLIAVKARGLEGCEDWQVFRRPFNWAELPLWGATIAERMNCGPGAVIEDEEGRVVSEEMIVETGLPILAGDPPTDSPEARAWARARTRWLNYNAFRARSWALHADDAASWALIMVATGLEPLSLPAENRPAPRPHSTPELEVEVAATWLRIAGAKMYACRNVYGPKGNLQWDAKTRGTPGRSRGTWDGVDGYHPDRWRHWKAILQDVVTQDGWRPNVIEAAKLALNAMEKIETETDVNSRQPRHVQHE